jgi:hypothetical protein
MATGAIQGVSSELEGRLAAVERITVLFRAERLVYLGFAIAAFLLLLVCVIAALFKQEHSLIASTGAFGSSGVVAFTSSRVLVMWNRAMNLVVPPANPKGGQ